MGFHLNIFISMYCVHRHGSRHVHESGRSSAVKRAAAHGAGMRDKYANWLRAASCRPAAALVEGCRAQAPHPISQHHAHVYIRPRPPHRPQGMSPRVHWSPSGHTYTHARGSPWLSPFPSQPHPASPSCINHIIRSTAVPLLITTQLHGTRSTLMAGA